MTPPRRWLFLLAAVAIAAVALLGVQARPARAQGVAAELSREDLQHAIKSTVLIYTLDNNMEVIASGSGSIIDERGLILTNFHVIGDNDSEQLYNSDGYVVVAVTNNTRRPAVPMYFGQAIRGDATLDLALVSVVADINGDDLSGCQQLPTYTLGDSSIVEIGDPVTVVGFPGIGGQSVTVTEGEISGFQFETQTGDIPDWFKTSAEVNPGNSGGSAVATDGTLIGVPSAGVVDVEAAGKISLIRPIELAEEVLAGLGSVGVAGCRGGTTNPTTPPGPTTPISEGDISLTDLGFSLSPDDEDYIDEAPSGTEEIFYNFEYSGASADTPLAAVWSLDGQQLPETAFEYEEWPIDAGDGSAYISLPASGGLPDGTYSIEIQAGDASLTSGELTVGGNVAEPAGEGAVITGTIFDADTGRPLRNALFMILSPGVTWDTFTGNDISEILDIAETDRNGVFQTNFAIPFDVVYSVGVVADGYVPIVVDDFNFADIQFSGNILDLGEISLKQE